MKDMSRIEIFAYAALATFVVMAVIDPAYAQSAGDPTRVIVTLVQRFLQLAGTIIAGVCGYKGIVAVYHGHTFLPALGGAISGIALCFGGSYLVGQMGGGSGIGGFTL